MYAVPLQLFLQIRLAFQRLLMATQRILMYIHIYSAQTANLTCILLQRRRSERAPDGRQAPAHGVGPLPEPAGGAAGRVRGRGRRSRRNGGHGRQHARHGTHDGAADRGLPPAARHAWCAQLSPAVSSEPTVQRRCIYTQANEYPPDGPRRSMGPTSTSSQATVGG